MLVRGRTLGDEQGPHGAGSLSAFLAIDGLGNIMDFYYFQHGKCSAMHISAFMYLELLNHPQAGHAKPPAKSLSERWISRHQLLSFQVPLGSSLSLLPFAPFVEAIPRSERQKHQRHGGSQEYRYSAFRHNFFQRPMSSSLPGLPLHNIRAHQSLH